MSKERHVTTAALLDAPGSLSVEEVTFEGPNEGQVLVRMRAAGVCHTDMHLHNSDDGWGFDFPMLLGHEGSGVVRLSARAPRMFKSAIMSRSDAGFPVAAALSVDAARPGAARRRRRVRRPYSA